MHDHQDPEAVEIDEGMRRWYASCRCCFGDAYPDQKRSLDEERRAARKAVAGPGICEVAEGEADAAAPASAPSSPPG